MHIPSIFLIMFKIRGAHAQHPQSQKFAYHFWGFVADSRNLTAMPCHWPRRFREVFRCFPDVFQHVSTCSDLFSRIRIHSDTFGCNRKKKNRKNKFWKKKFWRSRRSSRNMWSADLEELWIFECYQQIRLEKLPQVSQNSALCDFWRRGKKLVNDFFLDLWPKLICTFLVCWFGDKMIWCCDGMIIWWYEHMIIWSYDGMMIWWY